MKNLGALSMVGIGVFVKKNGLAMYEKIFSPIKGSRPSPSYATALAKTADHM